MALMLDPSLLTSRTTEQAVRATPEEVFVPSTFVHLVSAQEFDHPAFRALAPFLAREPPKRGRADLADRTSWVLGEELVTAWAPPESLDSGQFDLPIDDPVLRSIRLEEWAFLQSESWLGSRIRQPFDAFIKSGAAAIEFNRRVFDKLAARTLKISAAEDVPLALTGGQRLRAVTKWAAVGVAGGGMGVLNPALATPVAGTIAGFFLLFDP